MAINNTENEKNINELRTLLQNNKNSVFAFAGAGTSNIPGFPNWKSLIDDMIEYFGITKKYRLSKINDYKGQDDYINAATKIFNFDNNIKKYKEFLSNKFTKPGKCNYTSLHQEIIKTFETVITTNFDPCFRKAHESCVEIIKNSNGAIYNFNEYKLLDLHLCDFKEKNIVYLHGNWETKEFILKKDEYDTYYKTSNNIFTSLSPLELYMINVYKRASLVYIGFSFDDYYYKKLLEYFYLKLYPEECEDHKRIYQNDNLPNLPEKFVIISERKIKETINISEIREKIPEEKKWIKYLEKISKDEYIFKDKNKFRIEDDIKLKVKEKKILRSFEKELDNNKELKEFFDLLNFKLILFEDKKYSDIEDKILKKIREPLAKYTEAEVQI